jgi:hypothetical protein
MLISLSLPLSLRHDQFVFLFLEDPDQALKKLFSSISVSSGCTCGQFLLALNICYYWNSIKLPSNDNEFAFYHTLHKLKYFLILQNHQSMLRTTRTKQSSLNCPSYYFSSMKKNLYLRGQVRDGATLVYTDPHHHRYG